MQQHNIDPIYDEESKILILGSFPSVKSREAKFFYHHPQNRFWKLFSILYHQEVQTIDEKKALLHQNHIALWDVIKQCTITGSSDTSIKNVEINDINYIIERSKIKKVYTNGKKSHQLYQKYCYSKTKIEAICLPSTSPANAAYSLEKLLEYWKQIKE